jgi:hypothetical protein
MRARAGRNFGFGAPFRVVASGGELKARIRRAYAPLCVIGELLIAECNCPNATGESP